MSTIRHSRVAHKALEDPGKRRYYQALFNRVVSAQTERVVEFFLERYEADEMIREVQGRRAGAADDLRVKAIETRPPCS